MNTITVTLDMGDRDAIVLALAQLSLTRPGWHAACLARIAEELGGLGIYLAFRTYGPDQPRPVETSIECPLCHAVSHNENDIKGRYCGRCHRFHENVFLA